MNCFNTDASCHVLSFAQDRKERAKALAYLSVLLHLQGTRMVLKPIASKGGVGALAKSARIPEDSMEPLMEV